VQQTLRISPSGYPYDDGPAGLEELFILDVFPYYINNVHLRPTIKIYR
jgi:hypothetical protein